MAWRLAVTKGARADLVALAEPSAPAENRKAAARMAAWIRLAVEEPRMLEDLLVLEETDYDEFNVMPVVAFQREGLNILRLKARDTETGEVVTARMLYAPDPNERVIHILAVLPRGGKGIGYDYDRKDPRTKRICLEYDTLGIARIRR